ncbi:hypothetical protein ABW19_dt0206964 [Dactylella cylindrospora]|nr:hypothetical protein ABW19_dt0206964 [Dactylella cylindrospora]
MASEKRTTDVTEPTPNVESPLKKKVKTDEIEPEVEESANGEVDVGTSTEEPMIVEETNGSATETKTSTEDAAASWTPPPFGAICWIQIPAVDVERAKKFYEAAFDFEFRPNPEGYKEEDIAMFMLKNTDKSLSGGICKVAENSKPSAGTILYFMVQDVDAALEKVKGLGGKTREEKKPEGDHGLMGLFEDTEGNVHGVYQLKPAAEATEEAKE